MQRPGVVALRAHPGNLSPVPPAAWQPGPCPAPGASSSASALAKSCMKLPVPRLSTPDADFARDTGQLAGSGAASQTSPISSLRSLARQRPQASIVRPRERGSPASIDRLERHERPRLRNVEQREAARRRGTPPSEAGHRRANAVGQRIVSMQCVPYKLSWLDWTARSLIRTFFILFCRAANRGPPAAPQSK